MKTIAWNRQTPCQGCGYQFRDKSEIYADHIIPKSRGGTSDLSNLQPMHKACNERKAAK